MKEEDVRKYRDLQEPAVFICVKCNRKCHIILETKDDNSDFQPLNCIYGGAAE